MPARNAEKYQELKSLIGRIGPAVVAFSGGVDSSLLLRAAREALGSQVIAATERSPLTPEREIQTAAQIAAQIGAKHLIVNTERLTEVVQRNPKDRCYWCKRGLFRRLEKIARANGCGAILDGTNADDLNDFRPGVRAARETGVRQPLAEAGLTKREVRELAHALGLPSWNKESEACLASRVRYGLPLTEDRLRGVAAGEAWLRKLGFRQVRLRLLDESTASIEVDPGQVQTLFRDAQGVRDGLSRLGFRSITLDPDGYRTGSLNSAENGPGAPA